MDATLVSAAVKKPPCEVGEVSEVDPDAEFSKKNGKSYFGYKLHIGMDQGSGLIRKLLGVNPSATPRRSKWRGATFETIRRSFLKIAVRVEQLKSKIKIAFPTACPSQSMLIMLGQRIAAQSP